MESGLEDRNNKHLRTAYGHGKCGLNGVRPRRPEQYGDGSGQRLRNGTVSMESGLEDRNNVRGDEYAAACWDVSMESGLEDRNNSEKLSRLEHTSEGLNGVRPRRPEQYCEP